MNEIEYIKSLSEMFRLAGYTSKERCCNDPNCPLDAALKMIPPPLPTPENIIQVDFRARKRI